MPTSSPPPPSNTTNTNNPLTRNSDIDVSSLFKAKKPRSSNSRPKPRVVSVSSGWDEEVISSAVVLPSSSSKGNKRITDNQPLASSVKGLEFTEAELLNKTKLTVLYQADKTRTMQSLKREVVSGATATANIDGEVLGSGFESNNNNEVVAATGDSVYAGKKAYNTYLQKREGTGDSKKQAGPIRAPAHLRITSRFDYAPDICKDYKETGFCGYGDSCKFLHDRGDYKAGWQIDQEWDLEQAAKRAQQNRLYKKLETGEEEEDSPSDSDRDDDMPFACLICRKPFVSPVVTKCGHYFCEACALQSYAKTPKCQACGSGTQGIFDTAKKLIERLKSIKENQSDSDPNSDVNSELPPSATGSNIDSDSSEP